MARLVTGNSIAFETESLESLVGSRCSIVAKQTGKEVARLVTGNPIAFETESLESLAGSLLSDCCKSDFDKEVARLATGDPIVFEIESLECSTGSLLKDCCTSELCRGGWDELLEGPHFPAAKQKAA